MLPRCTVLCLALFCTPVRAEDFACFVRFPAKAPAILLIEAATPRDAREIAARARSSGPLRRSERVTEVVECIARLTERFSDPTAQRMLETQPI